MTSTNLLTLAAAGAALALSAAPAAAQDRGRTGRVADEIVREVQTVVDTIDRVNRAVDGVRYGGAERFAIDRCEPRVRQYGEMRVDRVVPHGNRSLRVYGTAGRGAGFGRYDRGFGARAFTCTVRDDGRVKFKTRRLRY